ncbi:hypothetical protein GCM10023238_12290 [Streptomyces heliomycini]
METAGSGGRYRLGRLGTSLLLLVPLLGVTAAAGPGSAEPRAAAAADAAGTRIVYAGTGHRSLGEAATTTSSTALFGQGPAHYDVQPSALGRPTGLRGPPRRAEAADLPAGRRRHGTAAHQRHGRGRTPS